MRVPLLRVSLLAAAVALLLALIPGSIRIVDAADPAVLDKPAEQLTTEDLQRFVELVAAQQLTEEQARTFLSKLDDKQKSTIIPMLQAKMQEQASEYQKRSSSSGGATPGPNSVSDVYWTQILSTLTR